MNVVGENAGPLLLRHRTLQQLIKMVAVVNVVAQHQGRQIIADKAFANQEGLRQTIRRCLYGIGNIQSPVTTVTQQLLKARRVLRRRDYQNVANARQHKSGQRVINHWFVVNRQQLLGDCQGGRVQTST